MNRVLVLTVGLICIDQLTKFWASELGIITLNTGISFGWLPIPSQTLLIISVLMTLLYFWKALRQVWSQHPLVTALFYGGALSNIIDRIVFGAVRDWLPLPLIGLRNNLADWFIFFGIIGVLLFGKASKKND